MTRCAGWLSAEPASVLHRFVSLANEPEYLALGWMRERSSSSSRPTVAARALACVTVDK
jgi:hypothetical protein